MSALWIALAFLVACFGGWPVTAGVLKLATASRVRSVEAREQGAIPSPESPEGSLADADTAAVLRGGLLIGILERGAVVLAIISGQPVAVAYVVAIKGLGRYPELKSAPEASERFIIGTLASMLWAAAVAALVRVLLL